jgi:hypothetical protein
MTLDEWLAEATRDAERRNLPELGPLLVAIRTALERLRAADWNVDFRDKCSTSAR